LKYTYVAFTANAFSAETFGFAGIDLTSHKLPPSPFSLAE
jgi:hypothetical protein